MGWLAATAILIVGLIALTLGGDWLVRTASRISQAFGVPPLVIGLTVVAFGTSAPEFGVSLNSAWRGDTELALGNVLGSNIFNVLFILLKGTCAILNTFFHIHAFYFFNIIKIYYFLIIIKPFQMIKCDTLKCFCPRRNIYLGILN